MKKGDATDPKGLISEAYKIDGITYEECRSIFLDWALSVPVDTDSTAWLKLLIDRHGRHADHPMTQVLTEGLGAAGPPKRRGGWRGRR